MKITKMARAFFSANFVLLFVFAFLPVLMIKPDMDLLQVGLNFMNDD